MTSLCKRSIVSNHGVIVQTVYCIEPWHDVIVQTVYCIESWHDVIVQTVYCIESWHDVIVQTVYCMESWHDVIVQTVYCMESWHDVIVQTVYCMESWRHCANGLLYGIMACANSQRSPSKPPPTFNTTSSVSGPIIRMNCRLLPPHSAMRVPAPWPSTQVRNSGRWV